MRAEWRNPQAWAVLGADMIARDPVLPPRPPVPVRAIGREDGSPSFAVDGRPVAPGAVVVIDPDDARRLVDIGKAESI